MTQSDTTPAAPDTPEGHDQATQPHISGTLRPVIRRPNYVAFIVTGAILLGAVGAYLGWTDRFQEPTILTQLGTYETRTVMGYMGLLGATVGAVLGAVVAVIADQVMSRRRR